MKWFTRWRHREQDLDDELESHLRMAIRERVEAGESPEEAAAAARREFGNVALVKDVTRDVWGWNMLQPELRWAWRNVKARGRRGVLAVVLLGLTLGANTIIFSAADSLVFHRITYRDPARLIEIQRKNPRTGAAAGSFMSAGLLEQWRKQTDLFTGVEGNLAKVIFLTSNDRADKVEAADVTPGLTALLGVAPRWGRALTVADAQQKSPQVVLIAESLARGRFGNPATAVGQTLTTTAEPLFIAGVMPRAFRFPGSTEEIWRALDPRSDLARGYAGVSSVARIRPGLSPEELARNLEQRDVEIAREAGAPATDRAVATPLAAASVLEQEGRMLFVLMAAALCLLLTTCANVASLELASAVHRARVYAIQMAVGASRGALCRIALMEVSLLVAAAGVLALVVALAGTAALSSSLPERLISRSVNPIDLDIRAVVFMAAVTGATWLLTALPVVLYASRSRILDVLRLEVHSTAGSRTGDRVRRVLTAAEVAVAVLLMIGGALYVRSYLALLNLEKGFDSDGVAEINLTLPPQTYPSEASIRLLASEVVGRLRARPGVIAATYGSGPSDVGAAIRSAGLALDGGPVADEPVTLGRLDVESDYFSVLRIPLKEGRVFESGEPPNDVIVSEAFANHYWPGGSAIGHQFLFYQGMPWYSVVGVVGRVRTTRDRPIGPSPKIYQMYVPRQPPAPPRPAMNASFAYAFVSVVVRVDSPSRIADLLRTVRDINPHVPLKAEFVDDTYARQFDDTLLATRVVSAFATFAFVIAVAGIYAVMSFLVATRSREIGVRMALGAGPSGIVRMVVGSSLRMIISGALVGIVLALAFARWLGIQLYGVQAADPATYALVVATVLAAAIAATWIPARQAALVDPVSVLRG